MHKLVQGREPTIGLQRDENGEDSVVEIYIHRIFHLGEGVICLEKAASRYCVLLCHFQQIF